MKEVQLIKRNEKTKRVNKRTGRVTYPGENIFRIYGGKGDDNRVYESRGTIRTATIIITPMLITILGGGFGGPQYYVRGTMKYNALFAEYEALEDELYYPGKYWFDMIGWYRGWQQKGSPPLNKTQQIVADQLKKYLPKD